MVKYRKSVYGCQLHLCWLGGEAAEDCHMQEGSPWLATKEGGDDLLFSFAVPDGVSYYLLCLHFRSGNRGMSSGTLAS